MMKTSSTNAIHNLFNLELEEPTLINIPTEVRVKIFEFLDIKSVLALRLVNHQIKEDIEEHVQFSIKLDQAYRGFRKLCRYRIKTCKIVSLTHHRLPRGSLFAHPSKLKKIVFDGNISQTNFLKIISHCNHIEDIRFTHETLGLVTSLFSSVRMQQFLDRNLRTLTHLNCQLLRYPLGDPFESVENIQAILSLSLPVLKSFKLFYSVWGDWLPLLKFLERHAATLDDIELHVGDRGDSKNTEVYLQSHSHLKLLDSIDVKALKRFKLKNFNFRDDVLNLNSTVKNIFLQILEHQKELQILQFYSPGDMTISCLRSIILKNELTLTEVVIYNLKNFVELPNNNVNVLPQQGRLIMDASVFQKCVNLRTLALSCGNGTRPSVVDLGSIKLIKLDDVPQLVERIHLTGFTLDLDEVVRLSSRSPNIKELLIVDAGSMKYSVVLKNVLRNCPKLEYLNVRPVITRANSDSGWWNEVKELSSLYLYFMGVSFDPIDDLEGFEAKIQDADRHWILENIQNPNNV